MKRDRAKAILNEHMNELREQFGVRHLSLFGSVARDEAGRDSDVDVLVEFDRPTGLFCLFRLQDRLEELFGCPVDLVDLRGQVAFQIPPTPKPTRRQTTAGRENQISYPLPVRSVSRQPSAAAILRILPRLCLSISIFSSCAQAACVHPAECAACSCVKPAFARAARMGLSTTVFTRPPPRNPPR